MAINSKRIYPITLVVSLILLSCHHSFSQTEMNKQKHFSSSAFPEIVYNYGFRTTKQIFNVELNLDVDCFNILEMHFFSTGDKTNVDGIKVVFIIDQIEVKFTVEKLFQDNSNHNLTQLFSFPEVFTGKKNITVTCEGQTTYFHEVGTIHITSQTTIRKIQSQTLTDVPSSLPLFPDWVNFKGSSVTTITKSVSTVFNNSLNFDKLNLTLSFLASDFSALDQHFEIEISNQIVNSQKFQEDEHVSENILSEINSGINLLNIHFSVEMCINEILLSLIHLTANGINNQDILPQNALEWYEWNNNEFDHSFDLSILKPQVSYQEQIVEVRVNYGCIGSVILPAIRYNIYAGTNTVKSGEIGERNQIYSSQTIITKFTTTDNDESITFRIRGSAKGLGYFYILNTSFITSEALPELQEQETLERTVIENESHPTLPFFSLDLTYTDYFRTTLDSYHHLFNISLSFFLTNEFGVAIREIHVLMRIDFTTIFDEQYSFKKLIDLQKQQTLYSKVYRVKLVLTIFGDGEEITLTNLKYSLFSSLNNNETPLLPENTSSDPVAPSKFIMFIEYGGMLSFFIVLLAQHLLKRSKESTNTGEVNQVEVRDGVIGRLITFPKTLWLKVKKTTLRLYLFPVSLVLFLGKTAALYNIIAELNTIAENGFLQPQFVVSGKWGFYSFFVCSSLADLVLLSTLFLIFASTFYVDLYELSKNLGKVTLLLYLISGTVLVRYIIRNYSRINIYALIILFISYLGIVIAFSLFGKTKKNQSETVKSFLFKRTVSKTIPEDEPMDLPVVVEKNVLSDEKYEEYIYNIRHYIIDRITPEIQVSVNHYAKKFQISTDLAHNLLIDVQNNNPNLGVYHTEERVYVRNTDNEVKNTYLDIRSQEKQGEFKSSINNNIVKRSTNEFQKNLDSENINVRFENFIGFNEVEQWNYILNLYPYSKFFNYEDFKNFARNSALGLFELKEDDRRIISYFFELCNVNIELESKRFEIIETLKSGLLGEIKNENHLLIKERRKDDVFLNIKCKDKYLEIGPYNENDFLESGFIKALDFILVDNITSILNTNVLIGFHLNKDGTSKTSQPIYEMLHILTDILSKNDYLYDLFNEKLEEIGCSSDDVFGTVYQQSNEELVLKWSEALSSFRTQIVNSVVSEKFLLTSRFKEILQLSNEFIEAITLINSPRSLRSYKIIKTLEIQNSIRNSIKNQVLNIGNEFIRLEISEKGIVTDVKLTLEEEAFFKKTDLLGRLFNNYSKWKKSFTGADGFTYGKKHFFTVDKKGVIQKSRSIDTIIIVEDKMRSNLGNITPYLHTSNLVRKRHMQKSKEDFELLYSLELTTQNSKSLVSSSEDEVADISMDLPFGGTMGCRRVIETFQKMFSLYPSQGNYFGRKEFLEILDKRSSDMGLSLRIILHKLILKKSILAFFQGEPCIRTDKDGLIPFKNNRIVSLKNDTDTLANLSKLRNEEVFVYCTSFYVYDGIKLKSGTIIGDGKKPLTFFNRFGINKSLIERDIEISIYSGAKNQTINCIQITASDSNIVFISPTIFYSENEKMYYVITNNDNALYANSYEQLVEEILFYFKNKSSDWIKDNNLELTSIYIENDKSTYHNEEFLKFDSILEKEKIAIFCLLKLQDILLNGVWYKNKRFYGINLFNSSLLSPEERTIQNYAPDISFYLSIFTTSTNTKLPLLKYEVENNYRIFSKNSFTKKDKKMLFLGCDSCNLDRNLELFIRNSETINKIGLFEQSEYEKYRSLFGTKINFKTSGLVLHSSIQLIYFLNLFYGRIIQEETIHFVLPLSYKHRTRKTKIYIEIQQNEQTKNKYDLSNLVEFLHTHENNNKIAKNYSGEQALGIYHEEKDIFINIQDLLDYQNNKLQGRNKIDTINSIINLNKNKKISPNEINGYINQLKGNRILVPYLPVTIRYDEQEDYNYLTLSKYNLSGMFRTLENSVNRRESSIFVLDDNFDVRLSEIFGTNRKEFETSKGIRKLYLHNPEIKEALTLMYCKLYDKNYIESSSNVDNFTDISYIHIFIDDYFKKYSGKRDKRTRLYNLSNYGGISINDQITTLLSLFAFKLYDCITNYGRYTHSLEHLNSKDSSSRDDPWIYRTSVNFENIARQEWNKFATWYLNHEIYLESDFNMNIISKYLEFNKILEESDPLVFNILTGFQLIFMNEESMPLVNFSDDLSIKHKVFKMQYDYTRAEIEKINITLFNRFNLLKYAFYDTLIRIWSSLMNIGTKKRKYYFQSIDNSVRKVLSSLTENDNSINDENANCIIDLEKARLLSYMTNTQLIQRQY